MAIPTKDLNRIKSSNNYKAYTKSYNNFMTAVKNFITKLSEKLNKLTTKTESFYSETATLTLKDNTVYLYAGTRGLTNLTIRYPSGDFISTIIFSTAASGTIKVNFPSGSVFVGKKKLEFFPQETWEINIHNKRVAAVQIFTQ